MRLYYCTMVEREYSETFSCFYLLFFHCELLPPESCLIRWKWWAYSPLWLVPSLSQICLQLSGRVNTCNCCGENKDTITPFECSSLGWSSSAYKVAALSFLRVWMDACFGFCRRELEKTEPCTWYKRCSFLQLLSFTGSNDSTNHCFQFRITWTQFGFLQYLSPPMLKDECKNWWAPNPKSVQCRLSSYQYLLTFDCSTTFVPTTINKFSVRI